MGEGKSRLNVLLVAKVLQLLCLATISFERVLLSFNLMGR